MAGMCHGLCRGEMRLAGRNSMDCSTWHGRPGSRLALRVSGPVRADWEPHRAGSFVVGHNVLASTSGQDARD